MAAGLGGAPPGHRLRGQIRETDTLARMGGDEFLLLLPDLGADGADAARVVAEKLLASLGDPFELPGGGPTVVTSSMGISCFPADGTDAAALQRAADEQLYVTKRRGRNGYSLRRPDVG